MKDKKIKWLVYTVFIGLIPFLCRGLVWIVTNKGVIELLNTSDFVSFGLVLHISNLNEIEHITVSNKSWKTINNGASIGFIVLYSVLLALTLLSNALTKIINTHTTLICSMVLCCISFLLSFAVYYRISKLPGDL